MILLREQAQIRRYPIPLQSMKHPQRHLMRHPVIIRAVQQQSRRIAAIHPFDRISGDQGRVRPICCGVGFQLRPPPVLADVRHRRHPDHRRHPAAVIRQKPAAVTRLLKLPAPVSPPGQQRQMPPGRLAAQRNPLRVNPQPGGVGSHPADNRLHILNRRRPNRLLQHPILPGHADPPALRHRHPVAFRQRRPVGSQPPAAGQKQQSRRRPLRIRRPGHIHRQINPAKPAHRHIPLQTNLRHLPALLNPDLRLRNSVTHSGYPLPPPPSPRQQSSSPAQQQSPTVTPAIPSPSPLVIPPYFYPCHSERSRGISTPRT